jgi:hypothetical protein
MNDPSNPDNRTPRIDESARRFAQHVVGDDFACALRDLLEERALLEKDRPTVSHDELQLRVQSAMLAQLVRITEQLELTNERLVHLRAVR